MRIDPKRMPAVILLVTASVFWGGCTSKVTVRETLVSAGERTIVGWRPFEGGAVRWVTDLKGARETGVLLVRLEREEVPVFRVKGAVMRRETITRPLKAPRQTEAEKANTRDIVYVLGVFLVPLVVLALPVFVLLVLCDGIPDSYYGPGVSTTTLVELPDSEVVGDPSCRTFRGIPSVAVSSDHDGKDFQTDRNGRFRINLVPWCTSGELRFVLKADLAGVPELRVRIPAGDVAWILRLKG